MKKTNRILIISFLLIVQIGSFAQCPMCAMSVEDSPYKAGINTGILYLLLLPFLLMGGAMLYWYFNKDKFNSSEKNKMFDDINYN
jgi:hypothetical protein